MWACQLADLASSGDVTMDEVAVDVDSEGSPPASSKGGDGEKEDRMTLLQPRRGENSEHYSWSCLWDEIK